MMIKKLIRRIIGRRKFTSEEYITYLRSKGIKIGERTVVLDPSNIQIDVSRPELLEIGSHTCWRN